MKFFYYVVFEITVLLNDGLDEPLYFRGDTEVELTTPIKSIKEIESVKHTIVNNILPNLMLDDELSTDDITSTSTILENFIFLRSETFYPEGLK